MTIRQVTGNWLLVEEERKHWSIEVSSNYWEEIVKILSIQSGNQISTTMQRIKASGISIVSSISAARLKRKAVNSWTAVQDTFYSTKNVFERHRVVFTVGTSIASVATAWFGYSLRHYHNIQVDRRLESIEEAMRNTHQLEHSELAKVVNPGHISVPACFANAGTTLIIGYCLGWRGGKRHASKQLRREQMKLLGEIQPRWQFLTRLKPKELNFPFKRSSGKPGVQESGSQNTEQNSKRCCSTRTSGS
ncbi:uncharacterized protein LOC111448941 isoform X1 [Cucurbita moschata]|uniref:Uncharacterized protein LOC111448941 isoform X1 n=1 Tax=Cucurbita moschata TaxID=3662 RepID=A0A6J1FUK9_CUCMO|nr:uncharacterized protein LOC111448941 isoform X1 [Cucurbita moschata]XP_022944502.1 uncharacterized protein LOC111448941 isoform X1 [Cucurbita moschata]